jgi:hypothetical protein
MTISQDIGSHLSEMTQLQPRISLSHRPCRKRLASQASRSKIAKPLFHQHMELATDWPAVGQLASRIAKSNNSPPHKNDLANLKSWPT